MVSVSKLDDDENHSLIIMLDKREFTTFSKKFKKKTKHSIGAFYTVKQLSTNTIKLTPRVEHLSDWEIEKLAQVTSQIIQEMGDYHVSIDGLYAILQKLKQGKSKLTKQIKYSLKLTSKLLKKQTLLL